MASKARQTAIFATAFAALCSIVSGCLAQQRGAANEINGVKLVDDLTARLSVELRAAVKAEVAAQVSAQVAGVASTDNSRRDTRAETRTSAGRDASTTTTQGVTSDDIRAMFIGLVKWAVLCYVGHLAFDAMKDILIARRYARATP